MRFAVFAVPVLAAVSLFACARADRTEPAASATPSASSPPSLVVELEPQPSASAASPTPRGPRTPPRGYRRVLPLSIAETQMGNVVLLADDPDPEKARLLPIFIGGTEALSIQTRLEGKRFPRPLTHDLYDRSLAELGARVVEARVVRLEGTTFIGAVFLETRDGRVVEVDARPSDAIALAIGNDAPIHVAEPVLAAAGVTKEQLDRGVPDPGRGNPTML